MYNGWQEAEDPQCNYTCDPFKEWESNLILLKGGENAMPSESGKQHRLMEAVAHSPEVAKETGIPQSVGKEFSKADKGKHFSDSENRQLIGMHGGTGNGLKAAYAPRQGSHRQAGLSGMDSIAKHTTEQ